MKKVRALLKRVQEEKKQEPIVAFGTKQIQELAKKGVTLQLLMKA
jgi:hypothetical protein